MVAYNSLGWPRTELVRFPVASQLLAVTDMYGNPVPSQVAPIHHVTRTLRARHVAADEAPFELTFLAGVPPLGFATYFVGTKQAGQPGEGKRRSRFSLAISAFERLNCVKSVEFSCVKGPCQSIFSHVNGRYCSILVYLPKKGLVSTPDRGMNLLDSIGSRLKGAGFRAARGARLFLV